MSIAIGGVRRGPMVSKNVWEEYIPELIRTQSASISADTLEALEYQNRYNEMFRENNLPRF